MPTIRTLHTLILAAFAALPCQAQIEKTEAPTKGTFYVSVDDAATIFINGKEFYKAGVNESRSPEGELKAGDRVVVHLRNDSSAKRFMLVFVSTDGKTTVSFRNSDFKIVPDIGVTDFTPEQLKKWTKSAKQMRGKNLLPVKSSSDWVWGDLDKCILASTITPQMFSQKQR